ncbi:MAG TPA: S26 family signal peptidase [Gaiellaceae bacterium]|nr:S26 family signal peptidase [Gaiellaceae bacterium]
MKRALILIACVIGAVIAAGYFLLDARSYKLTAASMEPTLHCARPAPLCQASTADQVVALKYVLVSPARGDVVVFHAPPRARAACGLKPGAILIKRITRIVNGRYFLRGDNAGASCDSRVWGTVPRGNLIGRVVATYWPLRRISFH